MKRVLVTRPEPDATVTAQKLRDLHFEPLVVPLSRVVSIATDALSEVDAVAVTSANALRHASPDLLRHFSTKPCFAVGAKTATLAREIGFARIETAQGDAVSLAGMIAGGVSKSVAYLTGRVRLPDFENVLQKAGLRVIPIEVYDTQQIEPSMQQIEALRTGGRIDATLIYSAKTADAVVGLMKRPELVETFLQTVHCCLSARVAERLDEVEQERIRIASRPEEGAIFALLP